MDGKKLKILMTTDTVGGVWTYSLELCRALMPYNLEIHLLGLGALPDDNQIKEINKFDHVTFYPTDFKLEWMENPWEDIRKTENKIETLCHIIEPDLFHFNNYISEKTCRNLPKITVYHSCVQTWWQAVNDCKAPEEWNRYIEHLKDACNTSDVVVFPTEAIKNTACQVHEILSPCMVIHNAREMMVAEAVEREKIILCTGRIWDKAKNLKALCELADQLPWPIYVAGDNANPNTLERVTLDNVRFLGKLTFEELKYWLERTEIYINPALYEPFGLAVLEAAKAGCALALGNLDSLQEVWQENALYFNPKNEKQIVDTLLNFIENDELRKAYQQKAKKQSGQYNLKAMGESYYQTYQTLLKKEKPVEKSMLNGKTLSPF